MLACIEQQMAVAESLEAELREGSEDWKCVIEWREELSAASAEVTGNLESLRQ
jgi:hypothetical protein